MKYYKGTQGFCMWSIKNIDEGDMFPYLVEFTTENGSPIEEVWLTENAMDRLVLASEALTRKAVPDIKRGIL